VRNIVAPSVNKTYIINNSTTGGYAVNIKTAAGTGIQIPNGSIYLIYCDGSEFYAISKANSSLNVPDTLVLRDGSGNFAAGTITAATLNAATSVTTAALTTTGPFTAGASVGTAGQALLSQGAGLPPVWGAAFVTGMIMLWSGSSASIPSGWLLCDGSSSTPDLRNRFVVGAGSTYAVGATGGSADATLVAHTHTGTVDSNGAHTHLIGQVNATGIYESAGGSGPNISSPGTLSTNSAGTHTHTFTTNSSGSSATNANLPPYYALCYIMKS
jgi:hypothetical protein